MKFASMSWPAVLPAFVLCGCLTAPLHADRLHLDSGGFIDSDHWWYDGDWLMYESAEGTIGIPRAIVIRIESGDPGEEPEGLRGWNAPSPPKPGGSRRTGQEAVSAELTDLLGKAQAALQSRDFESASSYFLEAVNAAPSLYVARVGYAVSSIALGRDGLAMSVVQDGLAAESTLDSLSVSSCLVAARPAPVTNPRPALLPSTVVAALPIRARLP